MARISNTIADFISNLLDESNSGSVEIQRSILAEHFECAPSQINYVLTTRFTPYKGYYVESRRGGGGYIRIVRVKLEDKGKLLDILLEEIGDALTKDKSDEILKLLNNKEYITDREEEMIRIALSDRSLNSCTDCRNTIRADMIKNLLLVIFNTGR